ncbi:MAG: DUF2244 domain-containing protein [Betaproteobacteria bacterium]|nr:DUF2244 domain-containing protein [Betaproteobacteria bacterium]
MVATIRNRNSNQVAFVITPSYAPASWQASILILIPICGLIMSTAIVSSLLGNWYALVPSSIVCVVLALAFRSGYRRNHRREVVSLEEDAIAIECGHIRLESHCALPRARAEVQLRTAAPGGHEHLYLCTQEQQVEIGEFLDEEERHELADKLRQLICPAGNMGPMLTA